MDNKFTNIKGRILQFAKYKGISNEIFCEKIGMTYGSFKGSAKNRPLNSDALAKLFTIFPELNHQWILTGEGEMIKADAKNGGNEYLGIIDRLLNELENKRKDYEKLRDDLDELKRLFVTLSNDPKKKEQNH